MTQGTEITIFTAGDIVANRYMDRLIPQLLNLGLKPTVFITPPNISLKTQTPTLKLHSFHEREILDEVIAPYIDALPLNASRPTLTFNQISRRYPCPVIRIDDIKDPRVTEAIQSENLCGALSVYNEEVFKAPFIEAVKAKGFFWNLHHGLLPNQRGVLIPYRVMTEGGQEYGCTLHDIVPRIDAGQIIAQSRRPLTASNVLEAYLEWVDPAISMIVDAVQAYQLNGFVPTSPQSGASHYYTFPTEAEAQQARRQGVNFWLPERDMVCVYQRLYGEDIVLLNQIQYALARKNLEFSALRAA